MRCPLAESRQARAPHDAILDALRWTLTSMKHRALWDAIAGLLAVAVALGVAELMTGRLGGTSLVVAVGDFIIDHSPHTATSAAIDLFGTNDKLALIFAIVGVSLVVGAAAGALAGRRFAAGATMIVGLGVIGGLAGAEAPTNSGVKSMLAATCSAGAGLLVLRTLTQAASGVAAAPPRVR